VRVLLTGANGFIGSHIADVFLEGGFAVRCLARPNADLRWLNGKDVEIWRFSSFDDGESIRESVKNVHLVVHAAGTVSARTPREYNRINAEPVRILLEACRKDRIIKRFVLVGSQGAAGPNADASRPLTERDTCRPVSAYGKSKLKAEEITKEYKDVVPFTIVRPSVVYGPRDPNLQRIFKTAKRTGKFYYFGPPTKSISLVHVRDIARGVYLAALSSKALNETYFLGSEEFYGLDDLRSALQFSIGREINSIAVPEGMKQLMMIYADLLNRVLGKKVLLDRDRLSTLSFPAWTCEVSKAKKDFEFEESTSLTNGFQQTYEWYCQNGWL